jgi:hypothetical protein
MARVPNFKLALTRTIEPTAGPGAELLTIEDAALFLGKMKPWRQARPHWDFGRVRRESDIEMATAQMERALRVDGWL